jgi:hypothetical protein
MKSIAIVAVLASVAARAEAPKYDDNNLLKACAAAEG